MRTLDKKVRRQALMPLVLEVSKPGEEITDTGDKRRH